MKAQEVYDITKKLAPGYSFDPILITAICEQESSYNPQAVRLENGFLVRYLSKSTLSPIIKALFATSFGLMQCLGQSLREIGYITNPSAIVNTVQQLDLFLGNPAFQIEWGMKWLDQKRKHAGDDPESFLQAWNGGGDAQYSRKVLDRFERLKIELIL
jgi:hypothetical protein